MTAKPEKSPATKPAPGPAARSKPRGEQPGEPGEEPGIETIRAHLKTLPGTPGVYRMMDDKDNALYVGKAKNLRKRVSAYTRPARQGPRIQHMVSRTRSMEFVTTQTEAEALLLEANLIKRLAPRYNILLRDDKSFPSIQITQKHPFPRVLKHRGQRRRDGEYFGPFASAGAVNQSLAVLQRAFLLRTCSDSIFANRTRPCLLHQIKRCAAPCAGGMEEAAYGALVAQARAFLSGQSQRIQKELAGEMQKASDALDYESAAFLRDRIRAMTSIQAHQEITAAGLEDADIIAVHQDAGQCCVQVFFFRAGCNYGNRAYYPAHTAEAEASQIMEAFLGQFYANKQPPKLILLSERPVESDLLTQALSERAGHRVRLEWPRRGEKRKLVAYARVNAEKALARKLVESASQLKLLDKLTRLFKLDARPERIEAYDNSHISGSGAVGAMIVAGPEGFAKGEYRKFNIRTVPEGRKKNVAETREPGGGPAPGDDYAMMREVLTRRFSRALKEDPDRASGQWPDLVLIDGGAGHLSVALEVFEELGLTQLPVGAIAKGAERDAGRETFYLPDRAPFTLEARDPVLYFLQRLRDEVHRFAIGGHRTRRAKNLERSALDEINGIGAARKRALLHHFGSARAVSQAGLEDLAQVEGISKAMARKIYDWFHADD